MARPGYPAPATSSEAELREKGSRFRAFVLPAPDGETADHLLAELRGRFPDATHACWARRLGERGDERCSDAGEPAGTAGTAMLQVLRGAGLSDVLAVVVRWYGGTKLGKGGLARAYSGALREALDKLATIERVPTTEVALVLAYDRVGAVKRLVAPPAVQLVSEHYGETAELTLRVHVHRRESLVAQLADLGVMAPEPASGAR